MRPGRFKGTLSRVKCQVPISPPRVWVRTLQKNFLQYSMLSANIQVHAIHKGTQMQTHTMNLVAANFWKTNQWKYVNKMDGRTQIFVSDCGVRLPHWVLIRQGIKGLSKGWNHHKKFFNLTRPSASAHAIGRQTRADIEAGWQSSQSLVDQIRRKNGSPVAIAQSGQDVPSRFGIQGEEWVLLRWARSNWAKRRTQGWSGKAVSQWLSRKVQNQNLKNLLMHCGPDWYTAHQP